jgi:hypothetical protein
LTDLVHVRLHIHNYIDNIQKSIHIHHIFHPLIPIDLYRIDL